MPKMAVAPANLVTKATDARKPALMASGDQSASSPVDPARTEAGATKKLETVIVFLVTWEKPVPKFVHQAHMGRTVNRSVSVQLRMKSVTQSQGDVPVCLATMETAVISDAQKALTALIAKRSVSA